METKTSQTVLNARFLIPLELQLNYSCTTIILGYAFSSLTSPKYKVAEITINTK